MPEKKRRPTSLNGVTVKTNTGCGKMYITINRDDSDGNIFEVFTKTENAGDCSRCQAEALTRSISLGLRYGVPPEEYINQLQNLRCEKQIFDSGGTIKSCPDAIAQVLDNIIKGNIAFDLTGKAKKANNTTPKASVDSADSHDVKVITSEEKK